MGDDESRKTTARMPSVRAPSGAAQALPGIAAQLDNRCRGLCLLPVIAYARRLDAEGFLSAVGARDAALAALIELDGVEARQWYPMSAFRCVHGALREISGGLAAARAVGIESAHSDLTTGIFRTLTKVASPVFLLERAAMFFRFYVEHGQLTFARVSDNEAEARFSDCRGYDEAIFQDLTGGVEGSLFAAGGSQIEIERLSGGCDGDTHLTLRVRWA
ncbi:MAG: hypothetical protein JNK04_22900 [Myxococcales bacterium]|nr:hypothetical protein [Myxococcales bacterium]